MLWRGLLLTWILGGWFVEYVLNYVAKHKEWLRGSAVVFLVLGILLLLEGGFRISTATADNLEALIPKKLGSLGPCVASGGEKDVIVRVYQDQSQENRYYFLEFSKNTLFDRYALTDTWSVEDTKKPVYNVVSSALRMYPYEVDVHKGTVTLFKHSTAQNVSRSTLFILYGGGLLLMTMLPSVKERSGDGQ